MLRLSSATIYVTKTDKTCLHAVIKVLQEEVHKRSNMLWATSKKLSKSREPQIILSLEGSINTLPETWVNELNRLKEPGKEGYRLIILPKANKVLIVAKNKRAMLYGVGKLLRKMEIRKENILVPENLSLSSTPRYDIRGHQLGYRPKTNSYAAWTVKQFDQYIRELAIFGSNNIEIPAIWIQTFYSVGSKKYRLFYANTIRKQRSGYHRRYSAQQKHGWTPFL